MAMKRIGVFVCHCGRNIAGTVDIERVKKEITKYPRVIYVEDYIFMCSDPGQKLMETKVREHKLDGVVAANCSPTLHLPTFRGAAARGGLNPYRVEIANIREWASWPHENEKERATSKAIKIIKAAIEKLKNNASLIPITVPVTKSVVVVGGGVSGIQTSLDLADAEIKVYLVEKKPSIGGFMFKLSETFPTLDCPQCILTPKMTQALQHKNIEIITYSELEEVSGYIGNFDVKIKKKATYIDWVKCTGCSACFDVCPVKVPSEYDEGLSTRKAIYITNSQAVPLKAVIEGDKCLRLKIKKKVDEGKIKLKEGKELPCGLCLKSCEANAITFENNEEILDLKVGAIVMATGLEVKPVEDFPEYGGGKYPDVINAIQFERLLAPAGPTLGIPKRPSDGKIPESVVFIQCVGSRDPANGVPYCSRVCCMYTAKQALLYKYAVHSGQPYIFYIDIRSNGKGYEEFVQRSLEEFNVVYARGKVAKIYEKDGKMVVCGVDTLTGKSIEIETDLVVLSTAAVSSPEAQKLSKILRIAVDEYGWFREAHLKLRPLETQTGGIFLAGASQFPKDITDCVAQASGAAAKIFDILTKDELERDPVIAIVDEEICVGCGKCIAVCPYDAIEMDMKKHIAKVNVGLCEGCGGCSGNCPSNAINLTNYKKRTVFDIIDVMANEPEEAVE